jgi:hypothetical protein
MVLRKVISSDLTGRSVPVPDGSVFRLHIGELSTANSVLPTNNVSKQIYDEDG